MKKFVLIFLLVAPFFVYAQNNIAYEINVIDSFNCFKIGQEGMVSLRAVNYNNDIHLAYIMKDTSATASLMYAIRSNVGFTFDTVAILHNFHNFQPHTSLQFDSLGNPHIYCARITPTSVRSIYAYEKVNNEWQGTFISGTGYAPYMVADPDGSKELGFAFWGESSHGTRGRIIYAGNNHGTWEFKALSDDENRSRNKPSILNYHGKTFVAFCEGSYPDTLITRIWVKENNNWSVSFEEKYNEPYSGLSIEGLSTKLGASSEGVCLMNTSHYTDGNPTYLKNDGSGWQLQDINFDASLTGSIRNHNIVFDNQNNAYWLSEGNGTSPKLSWIKNNGDGGIIDLPHFYYALWLHDMVIKNNEIYIYYFEGSSGWPYGFPVTFKEVKVGIENIFTGNQAELAVSDDFLLSNYPNPFQQETKISFYLPNESKALIKIFNSEGKLIKELINQKLYKGYHTFKFEAHNLPAGIYYCILFANGYLSSNKMVIVK